MVMFLWRKMYKFYYEQQINQELKRIHIRECRKTDGSTFLTYTGLLNFLYAHLKKRKNLMVTKLHSTLTFSQDCFLPEDTAACLL